MLNKDLEQKIHSIIDSQRGEIAQTLSRLIQIPSVTGDEASAQEYMRRLYSQIGLRVVELTPDVKKLRQHRAYRHPDAPDDKYKNRPDVLGILDGSSSARSLKLNAHVDVVTPEPLANWTVPPFSGKIIGDRLYGRGACDNKCGLTANYFALKCVLDAGVKPQGTVILESAVEEEDGGGGSLGSLLDGYVTDGMVVSDAGWEVFVATAGGCSCKIKVKGLRVHPAMAELGVNAILKMNKVCQALVDLGEKRGRELKYPRFLVYGKKVPCNLNIISYQAGTTKGVPDSAEITCGVTTIPGEAVEDVKKQLEEAVSTLAASDEWLKDNPPEVVWVGNATEPWEQDPEHPFVQLFKACAERALNKPVPIIGLPGRADSCFAQYFSMPAVLTGVVGSNPHAADEYVDLNSVYNVTKALASLILEWCGVQD